MGKIVVLAFVLATCSGCIAARQFADGFSNEALRQLGDVVEGELQERPASTPVDTTLFGGAGALLAYVLGSFGKGKLREMRAAKHGEEA